MAAGVVGLNAKRRRLTHVFLNGGKASVPDEAFSEFEEAYCDSVAGGHPMYVVERPRPDGFRMFLDVDFKDHFFDSTKIAAQSHSVRPSGDAQSQSQAHHTDALQWALRIIIESVNEELRDSDFDATSSKEGEHQSDTAYALVCTKRQKTIVTKNRDVSLASATSSHVNANTITDGVHVIWFRTLVDAPRAMEIRDGCVRRCASKTPPHLSESYPWERIIDAAVFRNNGLRMILSLKKDGSTMYFPSFLARRTTIVLETVPESDVITDLRKWVRLASVFPSRSLSKASPPSFSHKDDKDDGGLCSVGREGRFKSTYEEDYLSSSASDIGGVMSDEQAMQGLEELRRVLAARNTPYQNCRFTGIKARKDGCAFLVKTDSRFCMNLAPRGDRHRSNQVYFVVDESGVYQRCFCRCDTTERRLYGTCEKARVLILHGRDAEGREIGLVRRARELAEENRAQARSQMKGRKGSESEINVREPPSAASASAVLSTLCAPPRNAALSAIAFFISRQNQTNITGGDVKTSSSSSTKKKRRK